MSTSMADVRGSQGVWSPGDNLGFAMRRNPHVSWETQSNRTRETIICGPLSSSHWAMLCAAAVARDAVM